MQEGHRITQGSFELKIDWNWRLKKMLLPMLDNAIVKYQVVKDPVQSSTLVDKKMQIL